jgi:hypothetical protein
MVFLGCFYYTDGSGSGRCIQQTCSSYTNEDNCNNAPHDSNNPNGIINKSTIIIKIFFFFYLPNLMII